LGSGTIDKSRHAGFDGQTLHEAEEGPLSDVPLGDRWWIASDGKWYPPETHPDPAWRLPPVEAAAPPGPGWWQASDGLWYSPELRPADAAQVSDPGAFADDFSDSARHGGVSPAAEAADTTRSRSRAVQGRITPRPAAVNRPGSAATPLQLPAQQNPQMPIRIEGREQDQLPLSLQAPATAFVAAQSGPAGATFDRDRFGSPSPEVAYANGIEAAGGRGFSAVPDVLASSADGEDSWRTGSGQPTMPGFGKLNAPPSGSTVHEELATTRLRPSTPGHLPLPDGFDDLLQSAVEPPPEPVQKLVKLAEGHGHAPQWTVGGPTSAPRKPPISESDFYMMRQVVKRHLTVAPEARRRLSAVLFVLLILTLLTGAALLILLIHAHH
jgi:hypothetical protein